MTRPSEILVRAGRRSSVLDPGSKAAGFNRKGLVPVRGEAMVGRLLRTAADAWPDAELFLSVDDFSAVAEEPTVAHLHAAGRLTPIEARFHIVDSVVEANRKSTRLNSSH